MQFVSHACCKLRRFCTLQLPSLDSRLGSLHACAKPKAYISFCTCPLDHCSSHGSCSARVYPTYEILLDCCLFKFGVQLPVIFELASSKCRIPIATNQEGAERVATGARPFLEANLQAIKDDPAACHVICIGAKRGKLECFCSSNGVQFQLLGSWPAAGCSTRLRTPQQGGAG